MQGDLMGNFMANESTRSIAMVFTYNQFGWEELETRNSAAKVIPSRPKSRDEKAEHCLPMTHVLVLPQTGYEARWSDDVEE